MRSLLLPLACLLVFAAAARAEVGEISHDELTKALGDKKVVLLDANGTKSFDQGHIPGAIDYAANQKHIADQLPSDKAALIVAYCGGPKCEAYKAAADAAVALGYTNVKHLKEGIAGWKSSGAKIEAVEAKSAEPKQQ
jgi:rhodanese-related sulfurtransferase